MSECIHGLDTDWCATCLHGPERKQPEKAAGFAFKAKFANQCGCCNLPIFEGQSIIKTTFERYVHEDCLE
jgi:hypothetical protein